MKIIHLIFSIILIFLFSCKASKEIVEVPPPLASIPVPEKRPKVDFKLKDVITSSNIPGVYKYWPGWKYDPMIASDLPTPKGFEISPANANFIYSFLLGNVPAGLCGAEYMYFDKESYYVSHLWPAENKFNDAQVMLDMGVRINGKDGTVYNRKTKKWEVKGYIHKNGEEVKADLPIGITTQQVLKRVGQYFDGREFDYRNDKVYDLKNGESSKYSPQALNKNKTNTDKIVTVLHYWAKDGEIVLRFEDNKLIKVETQVKLGRH